MQQTNQSKNNSLSEHVTETLETYFSMLGDEVPSDVFQMVTSQVEKPMIQFVLEQTDYNQTRTADILGINRNTLRKKIQIYQIQKNA